jgi:transcriptional regulator with XRE-family HTH domain
MKHLVTGNYLKTCRNKSGLSQREMGKLLSYGDPRGQVSRHERSRSIPSLRTALAYELIFHMPVSTIFAGIYGSLEEEVEDKLQQLEVELESRSAKDRDAKLVAQKLVWLNGRKTR